MYPVEDLSEDPVARPREQSDGHHENDCKDGCGHPLFTRRPRYAAKLEPHAAHELLGIHAAGGTRHRRVRRPRRGSRRFLFPTVRRTAGGFVHHEVTPERLAGRTGLEPATTRFGDEDSTN